jgi:hypothetical protein
MNFNLKSVLIPCLLGCVFSTLQCFGQDILKDKQENLRQPSPSNFTKPLSSRVQATPDVILQKFKEAGMSPTPHQLTPAEQKILDLAMAALPPLQKKVLTAHLQGISFLDNMPNTALTSIIDPKAKTLLYHITIRAAILSQTVSQWLTEKENSCYKQDNQDIVIRIDAGQLSALTYVLLHESTHVVDGSLGLLDNHELKDPHTALFIKHFTSGTWLNRTRFAFSPCDSMLLANHFRKWENLLSKGAAVMGYRCLEESPFVSIYSTSSWSEDLAEYVAVYHFTQKLKQPFKLTVTAGGKEVFSYHPFTTAASRRRMALMSFFYS